MTLPTQTIGGLISGFDTASIIEQLMNIERRPVTLLQNKKLETQGKQEAYRSVNRMLLAYKTQMDTLGKLATYNVKAATSSNQSLLTATAYDTATVGSYSFRTVRTAQTHQMISGGFTSTNDIVGSGTVRIDQSGASLNHSTRISELNGSQGIYRGSIKITDRAGKSAVIDLSMVETIDDVIAAINDTNAIDVEASIAADGLGLRLTDLSGGAGGFVISEVSGGRTAQDLGIKTAAGGVMAATIDGADIFALAGTSILAGLRDGRGIDDGTLGSIRLTDNVSALNYDIDLSSARTLQDVMTAINSAGGGGIFSAEIGAGGKNIVITNVLGNDFTVADDMSDPEDKTATDLGIAGASAGNTLAGGDLVGGMDTVMLSSLSGANASGIAPGSLTITDRAGVATTANLSGAATLRDVIDTINAQAVADGAQVRAQINGAGNGIEIVDYSGSTANNLIVQNAGVDTIATDLGIETAPAGVAASKVNGGDLDRKYISRATRLETLNGGAGVFAGSLKITDGNGASASGDFSSLKTIGEVLTAINNSGLAIKARINDTGDGILLVNTAGAGEIRVEEVGGGTTAKDLGLLGSSAAGGDLDGSFEIAISIGATDTLFDVARKVGLSDAGVQTSVLNDGSAFNPYRLTITSAQSGLAGMKVIDADIASLQFFEAAAAQDALLLYGQGGGGSTLIASSSNTFDAAVPGLSLTVQDADPSRSVTVSVNRDVDAIVETTQAMVQAYNDLNDLVHLLTRWDEESKAPGLLFGDSRINSLIYDLQDSMLGQVSGLGGGIAQWYDVGIRFRYDAEKYKEASADNRGSGGTVLELDETVFRQALSKNFEAVRDLMVLSTDMARTDRNASASADNVSALGGIANLINGNTSSSEFGATNGYEATFALDDAINNPDGKDIITINLGNARAISQIALHHIDSASMPAKDYAIRDFTIEYFNTLTRSWETARTFANNTSSINYISLPAGTITDQIRLTVTGTNASDKKTRLVEIQAFESQGVASTASKGLASLTDRVNGLFVTAEEDFVSKISDIDKTIESMNSRLEMRELSLLREFTAMEAALAQMQAQSDFFAQQINSLTSSRK